MSVAFTIFTHWWGRVYGCPNTLWISDCQWDGQASQVNVVHTSDGQVAQLIVESGSPFRLAGSAIVGLLSAFLLYLLNGGTAVLSSPIPFILGLLCLIAAYIAGRHLLVSISSWKAYTWFTGSIIKSSLFQISAVISGTVAVIFSMVVPALDGLSYPARLFSRRPN